MLMDVVTVQRCPQQLLRTIETLCTLSHRLDFRLRCQGF